MTQNKASPGFDWGKGKGGTRVCPECGGPFRKSKQTLCPKCRAKDNLENCAFCGEPNPGTKRYCSRTCSGRASLAVFHADPEHQKRAGKASAAWLRDNPRPVKPGVYKKTRGDGENKHIHVMVAETVLGRPIKKGEVVHHEDMDKWNNHPDNLIVFPSQGDHARHHNLKHCGAPCECPGIRLKEVMPHESLD